MSNQLIDVQLVLTKAHVQPGMHVADFGCGRTSHVLFPVAEAVGKEGMVYAVDILKDVLETIYKNTQTRQDIAIHTVWTDLEREGMAAIPEKSLDVGFLINLLDQSTKHEAVLSEISRLLKDKARLLIVDWVRSEAAFGPTADRLVDFNAIIDWAKKNNFVVQEEFVAGPYHKGVVLFKQE